MANKIKNKIVLTPVTAKSATGTNSNNFTAHDVNLNQLIFQVQLKILSRLVPP